MGLTTNTRKKSKTNDNTITKFNIVIEDDTAVEFRPSGVFTKIKISSEEVLKLMHNGIFGVTAENNDGDVNFTISIPNTKDGSTKQVGFLNYYVNSLDDSSDTDEVTETLTHLKDDLSTIKLEDIHLPMTGNQASELLAGL
jgi:hypothetical protein